MSANVPDEAVEPDYEPSAEAVEAAALRVIETREYIAGAAFGVPSDASGEYVHAIARAALTAALPHLLPDFALWVSRVKGQAGEIERAIRPGWWRMVTDEQARVYDPRDNDYDLAADPRCLYGWGPPEHGCTCYWGHACFRAFGHRGKCWDAGGPLDPPADRLPCEAVQRPKDWDSRGRAEANA